MCREIRVQFAECRHFQSITLTHCAYHIALQRGVPVSSDPAGAKHGDTGTANSFIRSRDWWQRDHEQRCVVERRRSRPGYCAECWKVFDQLDCHFPRREYAAVVEEEEERKRWEEDEGVVKKEEEEEEESGSMLKRDEGEETKIKKEEVEETKIKKEEEAEETKIMIKEEEEEDEKTKVEDYGAFMMLEDKPRKKRKAAEAPSKGRKRVKSKPVEK